VKSRDEWLFSICDKKRNILENKEKLKKQYFIYMLSRTNDMFTYDDLPSTIPKKDLETLLQVNGFAIIDKVKDNLYAFYGGLGGVLNEYYHPTIATISNPYLNYTANRKIGVDCVVILNDSYYQGLTPMFDKYSSLLTETDISFRYACINSRILNILIANDDNSKQSLEKLLDKYVDGDGIGVALDEDLISQINNGKGINAVEFGNTNVTHIKDLIELYQYLKGSWFNELGLQSNFNMKRESINESESGLNEDSLIPLIDNMLEQRQIGIKKVNELFGTDIKVRLSDVWLKVREQALNNGKEKVLNNNDNETNEVINDETESNN